jgi:hypothetical protein
MVRLLSLSALILLLAAPTAIAGSRENILRECQSGSITGNYTPAQLRDARKNIPTDVDEYSDCRDVLARAMLSGHSSGSGGGGGGGLGGGGGGGTGGGGSVVGAPGGVSSGGAVLYPAGKGEEKALAKARKGGAAVALGGEKLVPGATGFAADAARNGLPTTLLTVLILLGLCALAAGVPIVRRRVLARRAA